MTGVIIEGPTEPDNVPVRINNEPIAIQCNFCAVWSKYKKEYCTRLPNGWRDVEEKGFQCNECRKGKA